MQCEIVKIKSGDSYIVINKSDFDEKEHTLYGEEKKVETVKKTATRKKAAK